MFDESNVFLFFRVQMRTCHRSTTIHDQCINPLVLYDFLTPPSPLPPSHTTSVTHNPIYQPNHNNQQQPTTNQQQTNNNNQPNQPQPNNNYNLQPPTVPMARKGKMSAGMRRRHAELQRKAAIKAKREAALLAEQEAEKEAREKRMASYVAAGREMPAEESSSDEEEACVGANASHVDPVTAGKVKVGQHLVIKGFPCKVAQVDHYKPAKHGHAKAHFVGIDIFTGRRYETITACHHHLMAPVVTKTQRVLLACKEVESDHACTETYHLVVAEDENSKSTEEHEVQVGDDDTTKLAKALRKACATHVPAVAATDDVAAATAGAQEEETRDGSMATGAGGNAGATAGSRFTAAATRRSGPRVMVTILAAMGHSAVTDMKTQAAGASKPSAAVLAAARSRRCRRH